MQLGWKLNTLYDLTFPSPPFLHTRACEVSRYPVRRNDISIPPSGHCRFLIGRDVEAQPKHRGIKKPIHNFGQVAYCVADS